MTPKRVSDHRIVYDGRTHPIAYPSRRICDDSSNTSRTRRIALSCRIRQLRVSDFNLESTESGGIQNDTFSDIY